MPGMPPRDGASLQHATRAADSASVTSGERSPKRPGGANGAQARDVRQAAGSRPILQVVSLEQFPFPPPGAGRPPGSGMRGNTAGLPPAERPAADDEGREPRHERESGLPDSGDYRGGLSGPTGPRSSFPRPNRTAIVVPSAQPDRDRRSLGPTGPRSSFPRPNRTATTPQLATPACRRLPYVSSTVNIRRCSRIAYRSVIPAM
jgi:hypothetical protein